MSNTMKKDEPIVGTETTEASPVTIPTRGMAAKMRSTNSLVGKSAPPSRSIEDIFADYERENKGDDVDEDDGVESPNDEIHVPFSLTLQTDNAHRVWNGMPPSETDRYKGYPGIRVFVTKVGRLCAAARKKDPYAYQALKNIEQHLAMMNKEFTERQAKVEAVLDSNKQYGITFSDAPNRIYNTVDYPIVARNQYALTAATFVGRFDKLLRYSLTARSYNQISRAEFKENASFSSKFIRLTFFALNFQYSGASVEDFLAENERARDAFHKHGAVDAAVLDDGFHLHFMDLHRGRVVPTKPHGAEEDSTDDTIDDSE